MNSRDLSPPQDFIELLSEIGEHFQLVQGKGGNCSIKNGNEMLIKRSGLRMRSVKNPDFFYRVGLKNGDYFDLDLVQKGRPSIEVFLHALLPHKIVIHLHSTKAVALSLILKNHQDFATFPQELDVRTVDYKTPGESLKRAVGALRGLSGQSVILLENHGSVIAAETVEDARKSLMQFEQWAAVHLTTGLGVSLDPTEKSVLLSETLLRRIEWHVRNNWRIAPDHVVFLGKQPSETLSRALRASSPVSLADFISAAFEEEVVPEAKLEQLLWYINVMQHLPEEKFNTLSPEESDYLLGWEAEKYRMGEAVGKHD